MPPPPTEPPLGGVPATGSLIGRAEVPDQPRDARHPAAGVGALAAVRRGVRRGRRGGRLRRRSSRRCSRTSASSSASARPPTSSPRRCTTSSTRAAATSPCARSMTASVCRAFVQHRPTTPWKVWYAGSNFRYEKPQRGRYRQFDQVGIEVLGADDPYLDVEVIALGWRLLPPRSGCARSRCCSTRSASRTTGPATSRRCGAYFDGARAMRSSAESRVDARPEPAAGARLEARAGRRRSSPRAPRIADFYSDDAGRPLRRGAGRPRARSASRSPSTPTLVRGLDYYRRTTFEFQGGTLDSAQNALGGGGRYDGLVEALGGPPTPGIGFALGARPHAARLRRRGRVRRADERRSTCSSSTRPAGCEALRSPPSCAPPGSPPTAATRTAA